MKEEYKRGLAMMLLVVFAGAHAPVYAEPAITFSQGVASGEVTSSRAVLWTRVDKETPAQVEVSTDAYFRTTDFKQTAHAESSNDLTVKVVATGLAPNRLYFYRWRHGAAVSEVGSFRTAPAANESANLRFAWTGDTDGSRINGTPAFNRFEALDAARLEGLDFFVYLGDTIYSDFRAGGLLPDAQTLEEFRGLYRENRDVPALKNLLQATSVYPVWDDHEVRDNWAGQTVDPFLLNIGWKAFLDYMPLTEDSSVVDPNCAGNPMFRVAHWGEMVDLILLDTRSCRSAEVEIICRGDLAPTLPSFVRATFPGFFPAPPPDGCLDAINDPSRTMLGGVQKALFKEALLNSTAKFKFVVSSVPIQQLYLLPYDTWEGYAAERAEILGFIRDQGIGNVIFLTTDRHFNAMNGVFIDRFADPAPIAYEFMTGPVATVTWQQQLMSQFGPDIGPLAVSGVQVILSLLGVDCRHLDAYSFGAVEVDGAAGTATIRLKDQNGNVLRDQTNPAVFCTKTLGM